jgi:6-phosphofructokinase 1
MDISRYRAITGSNKTQKISGGEMMDGIKTIGVLTSGGDAPGMNAAIRAIVRTGIAKGLRVMGILRGYCGLISGDVVELDIHSVSDIVHRGGTILYTARCPEFATEKGLEKAVKTCRYNKIDAVAVIGGDGSFRGALTLTEKGILCVGLPGTIDNDIAASDYSIGFDTAVNTVVQLVDKLRDTAESHDRCSVVEVMGRGCGNIALHSGIAAGATSIILPEVPFDIEKDLVGRIKEIKRMGKNHFIVIVAEGVGKINVIASAIHEQTGLETRATILGHVQRGGSPTGYDRMIASQMGYHAVELLSAGVSNRVVATKKGDVVDYDITEALDMQKPFKKELYDMAKIVNI